MTFKDIKTGYPVYILHKGDKIEARQGKVITVTSPRIPNISNPFQMPTTPTSQLVVDITIEEGGTQKTYTIPEQLEVTYAGNDVAIATNKDGIVREVEALKAKAEEILDSAPRQEQIKTDCERLLAELNPVYREKQANDERFGKLETQIGEIGSLVKNLIDKLT